MSKSTTNPAQEEYHSDNGSDNGDDEGEGEGEDEGETAEDKSEGINPAIIELLEEFVGHSVGHLSHAQLKTLLEAMPTTQTLTMETQEEPAPAVPQPSAGVGLAGRDFNGPPSHASNPPHSQTQNTSTEKCVAVASRKQQTNPPKTSSTSKRVRLATEESGSITQEESDANSDATSRNTKSSDTDTDSDSNPDPGYELEPQPNANNGLRPNALSQLRYPLACPQGGKGPKTTGSKQIPTIRLASSTTRLPSLADPTPSTSSHKITGTLKYPNQSLALPARHPPPNDLSDLNALTTWAMMIAQEQALGASSKSGSQQLGKSNTTTSHVVQAITNHRSQLNGVTHPSLQATLSPPLQPTNIGPDSLDTSTTHNNNTPTDNAETTASQQKSNRSKKASLGDFPGLTGEVASAAIPYFLATVFAEGAYENIEVFRDWALDAYTHTWATEYPEHEYEAPPKTLLVIMTRRASWLRGEVKKRIRAIVQYRYGFKNPAVSRSDIKHNQRTAKQLSANAFHCRDVKSAKDPFEHAQFIRGIGAGLHWDPESLGIVFYDRFKEVPIPAAALILTMMQACITEWRTGNFKAKDLDADKQQVAYEQHLLSLYEYERGAGARMRKFREAWAKAGLKYSGADLDNRPNVIQPYILASQIRPDTPPPNNEDNK